MFSKLFWGQLFFSRMRPTFFFGLLGAPILLASFLIYLKEAQLQELEARFARAIRKERAAFEKKERRERFLKCYSHADPYFLDQQIESLCLLQKEKEKLESLLHHPAFPESQTIQERLQFIRENWLKFAEENIQTASQMKEMEEKQRHAVQMDENDLQKLLSLIEHVPVGPYMPSPASPQLLITDLKLKKIETALHTEVFEVEMNLLKREFTQ